MSFLGGLATTDNLTGSCTAIESRCGKKKTAFLVDCGLVQGDLKNFFANNTRILDSIDPKQIDFVIVTHAHIDHIGLLPLLVNKGFSGKIICTRQTADLMQIMLEDSYKVQKEAAKRSIRKDKAANRTRKLKRTMLKSRTPKETRILFTDKNVARTIGLIHRSGFDFGVPIKLAHEITLKFHNAGHILGSAQCEMEITDPKSRKKIRLGFSGDLGRTDGILLYPPAKISKPVNFWFTESTYGGKSHPDRASEISRLWQLIIGAKHDGKKIIIPSFALERSQEIIYLLTAAMQSGDIPELPIYLDSPMAIRITEVFAKHWDLGAFKDISNLSFNPFNEENRYLKFVRTPEESTILVAKSEPMIVIASSGMCDAGRVRDYLRAGLPSDQTIVCLVGYMTKTSLGKKLKDGLGKVRMNDHEIIVKAKIESFESFSAHADHAVLTAYADSAMGRESSLDRRVFILHGEENSGLSLKNELDAKFKNQSIGVFLPQAEEARKAKV